MTVGRDFILKCFPFYSLGQYFPVWLVKLDFICFKNKYKFESY